MMDDDDDVCGAVSWTRIRRGTKIVTATLSTTNPILPDLESKPGRWDEKPATYRMNHVPNWIGYLSTSKIK
jgi:hypothetical protein